MAKTSNSIAQPTTESRLYTAPALEKGLDVLELLASQEGGMTVADIVRQLNRSASELFRMIQVLEYRGFIERSADADGYILTDKLFSMGLKRPLVKGVVEVALPRMRLLSQEIGQSCHLAVHSQGQIVVVARMESSEDIGFSVRVGYRRPLMQTLSGAVLFAFQKESIRSQWMQMMADQVANEEMTEFMRKVDAIFSNGWGESPSKFVPGVIDISAPICRGEQASAALTTPFVKFTGAACTKDEAIAKLRKTAREISDCLVLGDART